MSTFQNTLIQILIIANLILCTYSALAIRKNINRDKSLRHIFHLALSNILTTLICYIFFPIERHFYPNSNSILTLNKINIYESNIFFVKLFIVIECALVLKFLNKTSSSWMSIYINYGWPILIFLYGISLTFFTSKEVFNGIYLFLEIPLILVATSNNLVNKIHDKRIKYLNQDHDFYMQYGLFFLFGSTFPLVFIISYGLKLTIAESGIYNVLSSAIYLIFYLFIIKSMRCKSMEST